MQIPFIFKRKKENNAETPPKVEEPKPPAWLDQVKQMTESVTNFSEAIRNLEARTQDIMEKLDNIEEKVSQHDSDITSLKDSLEKMFVLYDWLMKQYNPFIEEETKVKKAPEPSEVSDEKSTHNLPKAVEETEYLPLDVIKDDPAFIAIILGWLNYLVSKSSVEETLRALEYYEDVGWITEDVKIQLEKYLEGFRAVEGEGKKLTPQDHLVSLYILVKLKSGVDEGVSRFKDVYEELVNKGIIKPI